MKRYKSKFKEAINYNVGINIRVSKLPKDVYEIVMEYYKDHWKNWKNMDAVNIEIDKNHVIKIGGGTYPRGCVKGEEGFLTLEKSNYGYDKVFKYILSQRS